MATCGDGAILVDEPDALVKEGLVVSASCGTWACDTCGPRKRRLLCERLTHALLDIYDDEVHYLRARGRPADLAWRPFKFLTLTADVKNFISAARYASRDWRARPDEAKRALDELGHAWNRLHACLVKWWRHRARGGARWELATRFPFFRVVEFTKNGWPHLHIILVWRERFTREQVATIRRLWDRYGIGSSVKLENRNWKWDGPARLAAYLSKYLTKSSPDAVRGQPFRRWSSSRGFLPAPERRRRDGRAGWSRADVGIHRLERERAGACITEISRGFRWSLNGHLRPPDSLTTAVWAAAVLHPPGRPGAPPPEFDHPGLSFAERLALRSGSVITGVGRIPTFVPEHVALGITSRRPRAASTSQRRSA
jgi:hypothetical protein